ncbi:MAG TPA: MmcQ/YjbR family DNA-binding protein [Candidatus Acidoferrales bacterium]|nr:MmcQ/YjbR family DNA-binding protein [Candidatus Acidoferrales bacterium]
MGIDWLREFCLSLAHTTEHIQWQEDLVFKVGGKMYAVARLEPGALWISLKCSDEDFIELIERPGIIPAPYLARAHWIAIESETTLARTEAEQLLTRAHAIVFGNLPKKTRALLAARKLETRRAKRRRRS